MSILIDKNTKVITQGMTGATGIFLPPPHIDVKRKQAYFTHILCKCGNLI